MEEGVRRLDWARFIDAAGLSGPAGTEREAVVLLALEPVPGRFLSGVLEDTG